MPASLERRMHPAHVPMIGIASSVARRTISSNRPSLTRSFEIVVLSPPGIVRASTRASSSGRRTAIASPSFPYSRIARATASTCSLTSPWTPMTPIRIGLPRPAADKNDCDVAATAGGHQRERPSAVLLIPRTGAADQLRDDPRERLRVGEEAETLARDAADHDLVPRMRRVAGPQDLVALRQDRLPHRRVPERVRMTLVERDDLEETVEQDRTTQVPQDRHADAVHPGIEGGVLLDRLAVDSNLEEVEFRRAAPERGDVPVSKGLDGESGCGIARCSGLSWH